MDAARRHGATVVYNMHLTPTYASAHPNEPCAARMTPGCNQPPANLADWDDFVRALVGRYKGRIQYYEVWDEPNRPATWDGSDEDMLKLADHAYRIIHEMDPNAKVITPGVAVRGVQPMSFGCGLECWLDRYLSKGGYKYADVISWHGFFCDNRRKGGCGHGIGCDTPIECAGTPLINQIKLVRSYAAKNGVPDKPIMDTSGGWGRDENVTDTDQRAAYISRWYVLQAGE
jgi:hypothetical protein